MSRVIADTEPAIVLGYTDDGERLVAIEDASASRPVAEVIDIRTGAVVDHLEELDAFPPVRGADGFVVPFDDGSFGWYDITRGEVLGSRVHPGFDAERVDPVDHGVIAHTPTGFVALDRPRTR